MIKSDFPLNIFMAFVRDFFALFSLHSSSLERRNSREVDK